MGMDRLDDVFPEEAAPSTIIQNETEYVRREYFNDGNKIFFSPLDFVLNGPKEGEAIARTVGPYKYTVKMGEKHFEKYCDVPFMCEVFVTLDHNSASVFKDKALWVVLEANEITVKKFRLRTGQGSASYCYSLQPQFFLDKGLCMMAGSDNNDVSIAFSIATGIPPGRLIFEDSL